MLHHPIIEKDPVLKRIFVRIPPAVAQTFSDEQLQALRIGLLQGPTRKHAIDVRFTLPILRFYFVILAGKEKRSTERLALERKYNPLWTPLNTLFLGMVSMGLLFGCGGVAYWTLVREEGRSTASLVMPIPWAKTEADCVGPDRLWNQGMCWDVSGLKPSPDAAGISSTPQEDAPKAKKSK